MKNKSVMYVIMPVVLALSILPFSWKFSGNELVSSPLVLASEKSDFDEPPLPVGGMEAIQAVLKYPEIARKAGLEGKVLLEITVDKTGKLESVNIAKSSGHKAGFEEAAVNAIEALSWKPAKKDGQNVTNSFYSFIQIV